MTETVVADLLVDRCPYCPNAADGTVPEPVAPYATWLFRFTVVADYCCPAGHEWFTRWGRGALDGAA